MHEKYCAWMSCSGGAPASEPESQESQQQRPASAAS